MSDEKRPRARLDVEAELRRTLEELRQHHAASSSEVTRKAIAMLESVTHREEKK